MKKQIFFKKSLGGFTLIELLIIVAIIGILSSIVMVPMKGAKQKSRDAARITDMTQFSLAQEMYYDDIGHYFSASAPTAGTPAIPDYSPARHDPLISGGHDDYVWMDNTSDSQKFCAYAKLEIKGDCTTDRYFTASHQGNGVYCDVVPSDLDNCWTKE